VFAYHIHMRSEMCFFILSQAVQDRWGQNNRGHFVVQPVTLDILNGPAQNLAQIKVTSYWVTL